jgi:hypothetical protein
LFDIGLARPTALPRDTPWPLFRSFLIAAAAAGLVGCASLATQRVVGSDSEVARCERAFASSEEAVKRAGVADGYGVRLTEFPYLRADRLLASFAREPLAPAALEQVVALMQERERETRAVELANLPRAARRDLDEAIGSDSAAELDRCADILARFDAPSPDFAARLGRSSKVPDDYEWWKRALGLYPLVAMPFAMGVWRYEAAITTTFKIPIAEVPSRGRLVHYTLGSQSERLPPAQVAAMLDRAGRNPLRIPLFAPTEQRQLAATFAPDVVVDEVDDNDRVGAPAFAPDGTRTIGLDQPVAFVRFTTARMGGRMLPQIAYTFWFKARPLNSTFDLLGGPLDGLLWRVTLGEDGKPRLFDSIHPCGCYHQFFPTPQTAPRELPPTIEETAFIPQRLPALGAGDRVQLRVESGTHFLQRIVIGASAASEPPRTYALNDDDQLRRLPFPDGGTRSFFGPDGIVPGSERGERYFFWPMGIAEPGAMRQWGRHATAFIGRRHFDDPFLLERYFVVE